MLGSLLSTIKKEVKFLDKMYFFLLFLSVSFILFYGKYRCDHIKDHKDLLDFDIFKNSRKYELNGWSISHLLFYMLLGYLYHEVLFITMFLSIIWELLETFVGKYKPKFMDGWGFCQTEKKQTKVWWYGKFSDPFINLFGLLLGSHLYRYLH
tara:strand:+ start:114 stop:569 length:456 start_codon:yes stop_codon:yes gene_type:complete